MSLAPHEISEANHRILDPLTDAQVLTVGRIAGAGAGTRVLDLACGKGELLVRWAQEFGASGVGVDDLPGVESLGGLLDVFDAGADLVEMVHADEASWDRYVAAQWATLRRWLDDHPDDPLRPEVRGFLDTSRRSYLDFRRRYLGWGVCLLRPGRS